MKHLIRTITLSACTLIGTGSAQQEQQAFSFKKLDTKIADTNGHYFAKVIADGKSGNFLVDSGASTNFMINKNWAEANGKKLTPAKSGAKAPDKGLMYTVSFGTIQLGNVTGLRKVTTYAADLGKRDVVKVDGKLQQVDGLIGSAALRKFRATFIYPTGTLLFPPAKAPKGAYVASMKAQGHHVIKLAKPQGSSYPFVTVKLGDEKLIFLIDTGASINVLTTEAAKVLKLKDVENATKKRSIYRVNKPIIGNVLIPEIQFQVRDFVNDNFQFQGFIYGGILGSRTLSQHKATLDFDSYSLIFPKNN